MTVFPECKPSRTPNGWITTEAYKEWFCGTFVKAVEGIKRPVILFVDGHKTHVNEEIHRLCQEHNIVYYVLPSHASHIVQPLDLVYYKHLKGHWRKVIRDHRFVDSMGTIGRSQFTVLFKEAWTDAYSPEKIQSSFKASGLWPFNPQAVSFSKCEPSQNCAPPSAEFTNRYNMEEENDGANDVEKGDDLENANVYDVEVFDENMFGVSLDSCEGHETESMLVDVANHNLQDTPDMEMEERHGFEQGKYTEKNEEQGRYNENTEEQGRCTENDTPTNSVDAVETVKLDCIFEKECATVEVGEMFPLEEVSECISMSSIPTDESREVITQDHTYGNTKILTTELSYSETPAYANQSPSEICANIDRLLNLVVRWDDAKLYHARRLHMSGTKPKDNEDDYREYLRLYSLVVPPPTFYNLPEPKSWKKKKVTTKKRPICPSIISSKKYDNYLNGGGKDNAKPKKKTTTKKKGAPAVNSSPTKVVPPILEVNASFLNEKTPTDLTSEIHVNFLDENTTFDLTSEIVSNDPFLDENTTFDLTSEIVSNDPDVNFLNENDPIELLSEVDCPFSEFNFLNENATVDLVSADQPMPIAFDPFIPGTSGYSQRKRKMTEKIKDKQESLCRICKKECPPKSIMSGSEIIWAKCDKCECWIHQVCSHYKDLPKECLEKVVVHCNFCISYKMSKGAV